MGAAPQTVSQPLFLPRLRTFGDDLAPPRPAFFTLIPAVLAVVGMLVWMMGDDAGFVLACAVATVIGFYTLWDWLFRKGPTRFSTITAMALLIGYGAGALNTWATLPRGSLSISATMGLPQGVLARAIGAVLIVSALLYFLGEIFEKPIFGRDFRFTVDGRTRTLVCIGALAMIAGYATHAIGFQGPTSVGSHLNPFGAFLAWLYAPLTAISVTAFLTAPRGKSKVLSGITMMVLLLMFSVMGRRSSVYTAVEILLVLGFSAYQWRGRTLHKALMILALAGVVIACSLTFMLLRIAGLTSHRTEQVTVAKRIEVAGRMVKKGGAYALAASTTTENVQRRTFVLGFLASVLEGSMKRPTAHGVDAAMQAQLVIPSFIYPDKDLSFSEEGLVDRLFGYGFGDQPNSILTAGATDFGLAGLLLYPLLLVGFSRILFDLLARCFRAVPLMFVALSFILSFLQTESTITGYLETLRVSLFFGLVIAGFLAMPKLKLYDS
ncbi:MAG: hypothetical protein WBD10_06700 [Acidobacteriaceae bacterium]